MRTRKEIADKQERIALGTLIRNARIAAQSSQQEIAKTIGISQAKLSKIESGRLTPNIFEWHRICDQFNFFPKYRSDFKSFISASYT